MQLGPAGAAKYLIEIGAVYQAQGVSLARRPQFQGHADNRRIGRFLFGLFEVGSARKDILH